MDSSSSGPPRRSRCPARRIGLRHCSREGSQLSTTGMPGTFDSLALLQQMSRPDAVRRSSVGDVLAGITCHRSRCRMPVATLISAVRPERGNAAVDGATGQTFGGAAVAGAHFGDAVRGGRRKAISYSWRHDPCHRSRCRSPSQRSIRRCAGEGSHCRHGSGQVYSSQVDPRSTVVVMPSRRWWISIVNGRCIRLALSQSLSSPSALGQRRRNCVMAHMDRSCRRG